MVQTNNSFVNEFIFDSKLLYNEDIHKLMDLGIEYNNTQSTDYFVL